jgi:LuxR family maltose regulon positive regulatory protein
MCYAQGNLAAARDLLRGLEPVYQQNAKLFASGEFPAWRARWQATLGQPAEARAWLSAKNLAVPTVLGVLQGAILLTAARVMLALDETTDALALLPRVEAAATAAVFWQVESLVLQAVAWRKKDKNLRALDCLEKALLLAEKAGFVRVFLDEAPVITDLLRQAASRDASPRYAARLLEAISVKVSHPAPPASAQPDLLEPLSEREQEVLKLIARGRLNKEIAGELVIAVGTVKRHTANIFRKLDVINRTQAVARSRELGLI